MLRHQIGRLLSGAPSSDLGPFLNELLVEFLVCKGFVRTEMLSAALLATPRHDFLPGVNLRHAYRDQAVATVCDGKGWFESSCSTPSIVCSVIEALHLEDARRILELGAGTGYTSALMSRCAPDAEIVTLEVLDDVARETAERLAAMGLDRVEVRSADGSQGSAGPGPYDRIVLACGANGIPSEIAELLAEGGILVIPVGSCIFVFEKIAGQLVGQPMMVANFIAFANNEPQSTWHTHGGVSVLWPSGVDSSQTNLGAPDFTAKGPAIRSHQVASWLLWTSLHYPDDLVILSEKDGGWGFGLHDKDLNATVICRLDGELSFRHYHDRAEHIRFECWGDVTVSDRLLAISENLAELGWPEFDRMAITVDLHGEEPTVLASNQFRIGAHTWSVEISGFEVLRSEASTMSQEPARPAGV